MVETKVLIIINNILFINDQIIGIMWVYKNNKTNIITSETKW